MNLSFSPEHQPSFEWGGGLPYPIHIAMLLSQGWEEDLSFLQLRKN